MFRETENDGSRRTKETIITNGRTKSIWNREEEEKEMEKMCDEELKRIRKRDEEEIIQDYRQIGSSSSSSSSLDIMLLPNKTRIEYLPE